MPVHLGQLGCVASFEVQNDPPPSHAQLHVQLKTHNVAYFNTKFCSTQNVFQHKMFFNIRKFFQHKFFFNTMFFNRKFLNTKFLNTKIFNTKIVVLRKIFNTKLLC